ncbi:hypothetical protein D3C78_22280 [compost metagenome]
MDVQSQLLFIGSSADIKIMVAERERVRGLGKINQHTRRCPSPVLPLREETRSFHIRLSLRRNNSDVIFHHGPRRPSGNVGQQAKNSAQPFCSQARKMPFDLN